MSWTAAESEARRRFRTHNKLSVEGGGGPPKALSPLRSASAHHDAFRVIRVFRGSKCLGRNVAAEHGSIEMDFLHGGIRGGLRGA